MRLTHVTLVMIPYIERMQWRIHQPVTQHTLQNISWAWDKETYPWQEWNPWTPIHWAGALTTMLYFSSQFVFTKPLSPNSTWNRVKWARSLAATSHSNEAYSSWRGVLTHADWIKFAETHQVCLRDLYWAISYLLFGNKNVQEQIAKQLVVWKKKQQKYHILCWNEFCSLCFSYLLPWSKQVNTEVVIEESSKHFPFQQAPC